MLFHRPGLLPWFRSSTVAGKRCACKWSPAPPLPCSQLEYEMPFAAEPLWLPANAFYRRICAILLMVLLSWAYLMAAFVLWLVTLLVGYIPP